MQVADVDLNAVSVQEIVGGNDGKLDVKLSQYLPNNNMVVVSPRVLDLTDETTQVEGRDEGRHNEKGVLRFVDFCLFTLQFRGCTVTRSLSCFVDEYHE